jgi:hypothetical protein
MSLPDFNGMSDDEIVQWVNGHGLVDVMRSLSNQADTFPRPTEIHIRPEVRVPEAAPRRRRVAHQPNMKAG